MERDVPLPSALHSEPWRGGPLRHLHKEAVGSSEHPLGGDQRAPADVGGAVVQTDLPGPRVLWGQHPSHDPPGRGPQSAVWGGAEETR